ncbi:NUDIX hydrolase domain-like protein [Roridomyces roridus]|uniref:NUDIX hydrolase domain-like protein n=1 Tax=Roridomyces roridus TaxID=1738132 RepID=A0AAD7B1P3_9AGAR|nr:NUDIX hydrolase domain-like protein [Roridomyces roridus]
MEKIPVAPPPTPRNSPSTSYATANNGANGNASATNNDTPGCAPLSRRWFSATPSPSPPPPPRMSQWSSAQVPDSGWADENFQLGAGMVVLQQTTLKVAIIWEKKRRYWFLPKGRKDVGESLEQTALREAYEESGYRVSPLPIYTRTRAPGPPDNLDAQWSPNCEPIYICTTAFAQRRRHNFVSPPGEYLTFWYLGQIPEDAVHEEGTGMPDEVNYETHLVSPEEAMHRLFKDEARVVQYAWALYRHSLKIEEYEATKRQELEAAGEIQ